MKCISCKHEHNEKFCPNCGEKSKVKRISFRTMLESSFLGLANMDKGFLYNLKYLTIRPKQFMTDYINGKRKGVFNPVSYLIISVSIYLLVEPIFKRPLEFDTIESDLYSFGYEVGKFIKSYYKYFWILSILWLGIANKLIFQKYNFAEHLTISSFIIGHASLAGLLGLIIFNFPLIGNPIVYLVIWWMTYQLFKGERDKINSFVISFISMILFFMQLFLVAILIGFIKTAF